MTYALMGRGPVQCREASSHQAAGRQVDASWSGRICTWPVLTTDIRRIGSVTFISLFLRSGFRVASACSWDPAVPVVVVGADAEGLGQRPQRGEHEVLHPDRRGGDPA